MSTDLKAKEELVAGRMTRQEVALRLGISIRSVQRLDAAGELHPVQDEETGRVWYAPAEVKKIAAERGLSEAKALPEPVQQTRGRVAAELFRLFEKGIDVNEAVIETEIEPETVASLYEAWLAPQDHVIRSADWQRLQKMIPDLNSVEVLIKTVGMLVNIYCALRDFFGPVTTAGQLEEKVQELVDARNELRKFKYNCPSCGKRYQATSDREWKALLEDNVFAKWHCESCYAKNLIPMRL